MRKLIMAVALIAATSVARGEEPGEAVQAGEYYIPAYDVEHNCRADYYRRSGTINRCIHDEQEAYDYIKSVLWPSVSDAVKERALVENISANSLSYGALAIRLESLRGLEARQKEIQRYLDANETPQKFRP